MNVLELLVSQPGMDELILTYLLFSLYILGIENEIEEPKSSAIKMFKKANKN